MSLSRLAPMAFALAFLVPALGQQASKPAPPQAQPPADQQPASPATPAAPETETTSPVGHPPETSTKPATPALDLNPDANGALSQKQMQQLFRVVADKDRENDKRQRDYTYIERQVQKRVNGKGEVTSTQVETSEVLQIYGEQVERLIEKDDKPLSTKDAAKEEAKIQKIIDKRKNESESDRKKREENEIKDREDSRKFETEVADAYNFKLVGTESLGGREAWVIDAEPRPGFVPQMKESKLLSKFRGRVWIDKADLQLAKLDVECLDTVSFGWFLARFHKGTRITVEQTRINNEVWLPLHVAAKIDVRVALLKNFDLDLEQAYRDYKKFRSSSKIVSVTEVQDKGK
jgi:hypothetical protein